MHVNARQSSAVRFVRGHSCLFSLLAALHPSPSSDSSSFCKKAGWNLSGTGEGARCWPATAGGAAAAAAGGGRALRQISILHKHLVLVLIHIELRIHMRSSFSTLFNVDSAKPLDSLF